MHAPATDPIGLQLIRPSQQLTRTFDTVLTSAGGSLSTWLGLFGRRRRPLSRAAAAAASAGRWR